MREKPIESGFRKTNVSMEIVLTNDDFGTISKFRYSKNLTPLKMKNRHYSGLVERWATKHHSFDSRESAKYFDISFAISVASGWPPDPFISGI